MNLQGKLRKKWYLSCEGRCRKISGSSVRQTKESNFRKSPSSKTSLPDLNVRRGFNKCVHHLLPNWTVHNVPLQHGKQHNHHLLLEVHEFAQEVQLVRIFTQLFLHMSEDVQEATDGVPQSTVCQSKLVSNAGALNVLCQRAEDLFANLNGTNEVLLAGFVDRIFSGVMPVEVHDGLL